jgi:Uma2 family endonuclease
MTTTFIQQKPVTEAYLRELEARGIYVEVTDGELQEIEDVTGEDHGWIETNLIYYLTHHTKTHKLGRVYPGDTDFVLSGSSESGTIRVQRRPDVSFIKAENVVATTTFIYRAPDLAIEIISPSQNITEIRQKIAIYFEYGTQQVWIVDPALKQVTVCHADGTAQPYSIGDHIPGGDLLPGLALDVAFVFER